jgi:hypothetical protein
MAAPTFVAAGTFSEFLSANGPINPGAGEAADDWTLGGVATFFDEASGLATANGMAAIAGAAVNASTTIRLTAFGRLCTVGTAGTVPLLTDSGQWQHARGLTFRGTHLTTPVHAVTTGEVAAGTSPSIVPGMTTTADECLIILIVAGDGPDVSSGATSEFSAIANAGLANVAELVESGSNRGNGSSLGFFAGDLATAGAVGTFTLTSATSTAKAWACIAIQPPAAAAGGSSVGALAGEGGNASALRGGNAGVGGGNAAFEMVRGIWQQRPRLIVPVGLTLRGA